MKKIINIFLLFSIIFMGNVYAKDNETPWSGFLQDGTKINHEQLNNILKEHEIWLLSNGKNGKRADLNGANLKDVNLKDANLIGADLSNSKLIGAYLMDAYLSGANLRGANLSDAAMLFTDLSNAKLNFSDLSRAHLIGANLIGADLTNADLSDAWLMGAKLKKVIFELKPKCLPDVRLMFDVRSLSEISYNFSPHALVELRDAFKKAGLRTKEREVTYAIKHTKVVNIINKPKRNSESNINNEVDLAEIFETYLSMVLFEWTHTGGCLQGDLFESYVYHFFSLLSFIFFHSKN